MVAKVRESTGLCLSFGCRERAVVGACVVALLALFGGCQSERSPADRSNPTRQGETAETRPVVFVSNSFLSEVVEAIAGERVEKLYLLPPHQEPTAWKPTAADLEKMQRARLLVLNGAEFEPWVAGVALPSSRMLRTANVFLDQWIETEAIVHSHGPGGEHSHAGIASTTWLDFELAKLQANAVRERLEQLLPGAAEDLKQRSEKLLADLDQLDRQMRQLAGRIGSRPLVASHPFQQYWAKRYGLNVRSVNWDASEVPGPAGLEELQRVLQDFPATVFLWESEPAADSVELLRGKGLASIVFSPAANLPAEDSWLEAMRRNLSNLEQAIKQLP